VAIRDPWRDDVVVPSLESANAVGALTTLTVRF